MSRILYTSILLLAAISVSAQQPDLPKEVSVVLDYVLKKDYPEVFNDKSYQVRPVAWHVIDIDGDGITEVFLQTFPHFSQSPTITIYQINKGDSVTRIIEGLAPGRLIPPSAEDDFISPHETGTAADMQVGQGDLSKMLKMAQISSKHGMSPVVYRNFLHTDKRTSKTYLDLTYLDDLPTENSCKNFQFSKPDAIAAGSIAGSAGKYLIARCGTELFCYKISGFEAGTYVKKEVTIIPLPSGFTEFVIEEGTVKYKAKRDKVVELKL